MLIEDTAVLWGDNRWGSAYLFNNGAKDYQWTDGMAATSLLHSDSSNTYLLNDDAQGQ